MKPTRPIVSILVAATLALAGCVAMTTASDPAQPRATVKVENRAFLDMTIYVLRGSERVRLGQVPGSSDATFVIPGDLIRTAMPLRFVADPIGSARAEISEQLDVHPGDEVTMRIPPA